MMKELNKALAIHGGAGGLALRLVDDTGTKPKRTAINMWMSRGKVPYRWREPLRKLLTKPVRKKAA